MSKLGIVAFALSVTLATPTFAASTASASFSDFTVTLVDLDPKDTFAPVITWNVAPGAPGGSTVSGSVSTLNPSQPRSFTVFGPNPFSSIQGSARSEVAFAAARIVSGPGGQINGGSAFAQGFASALPGMAPSVDGFSYFAQALPLSSTEFTLSPHTAAIFSGQGTAFASTSVGAIERNGFRFAESASARVEMRVEGPGPGGDGDQQDVALVAADASFRESTIFDPRTGQTRTVFSPEAFRDSRRLSVTFTNSSGQPLTGGLSINVAATGFSAIPAVPEPESYAMLAAGLGVMGSIARRRKATS